MLWGVGWRESFISSRSQRGVLYSGVWGGENLLSHHAAREVCYALGCGVERIFFLITQPERCVVLWGVGIQVDPPG